MKSINIKSFQFTLLFSLLFSLNSKAQTCSSTFTCIFIGNTIDSTNIQPVTLCANRVLPFYYMHAINCGTTLATGAESSWNFGDGTSVATTTMMTVPHTYTAVGNYSVTITCVIEERTWTLTVPVIVENCCCSEDSEFGISFSGSSFSSRSSVSQRNCAQKSVFFEMYGCANMNTASHYPLAGVVYSWNFGDGSVSSLEFPSHTYSSPGTYSVNASMSIPGCTTYTAADQVEITVCDPLECEDCLGTFQPAPGKYMLSLWVKEDVSVLPNSFSNPHVEISFTGDPLIHDFYTNPTKNKIIDGWQKIEEEFIIPALATDIQLNLLNASSSTDAYFDDVRIFPMDGQMKSYVYDPITLLLTATLDENNYATFYEYDEEGKLIRVKKETEKGIVTIQESREGNKKK